MKFLIISFIMIILAGCAPSDEGEKKTPTKLETERRRSVFWQYEEPRMQLDPIAEEEIPAVLHPVEGDAGAAKK